MDIKKEVLAIVSAKCLTEDDPKMDSDLYDDLAFDSLDVVEVCIDVERRFGINVEPADYDHWRTPADICRTVREMLERKEKKRL